MPLPTTPSRQSPPRGQTRVARAHSPMVLVALTTLASRAPAPTRRFSSRPPPYARATPSPRRARLVASSRSPSLGPLRAPSSPPSPAYRRPRRRVVPFRAASSAAPPSDRAHPPRPAPAPWRRAALALAVFLVVTALVAVEGCGGRVRVPGGIGRALDALPPRWRPSSPALHPGALAPFSTLLLSASLVFTPALDRASRWTFAALARFLALALRAPAWITAATQTTGAYFGVAARLCVAWALSNRLARLVDPSVPVGVPPLVADAAAAAAALVAPDRASPIAAAPIAAALAETARRSTPSSVTAGDLQMWFFDASGRVLLASLCVVAARWATRVKRPPPRSSHDADGSGSSTLGLDSDPVSAHFAALRGDEGVSWDRQARSVLVDSALSLATTAAATLAAARALRVDVTGALAVGGVGGIAVGFAAQRCVANFISGALIFVAQPFKVGDLVAVSGTTDPASGGPFRGVVTKIGWHSTVLESSWDGSALIVPNADVGTNPVRNLSRRAKRVACETLPLPPNASARRAVFETNRTLRGHPAVAPPSADVVVDRAAAPRCALVSVPGTGATLVRCSYLLDDAVPDAWSAAARSGVLVALTEALERAAEETIKVKDESSSRRGSSSGREPTRAGVGDARLDARLEALDGEEEAFEAERETVREAFRRADHHFRDAERRARGGDSSADDDEASRRVAEVMRRGERTYEEGAGRYRDEETTNETTKDGAKRRAETGRETRVERRGGEAAGVDPMLLSTAPPSHQLHRRGYTTDDGVRRSFRRSSESSSRASRSGRTSAAMSSSRPPPPRRRVVASSRFAASATANAASAPTPAATHVIGIVAGFSSSVRGGGDERSDARARRRSEFERRPREPSVGNIRRPNAIPLGNIPAVPAPMASVDPQVAAGESPATSPLASHQPSSTPQPPERRARQRVRRQTRVSGDASRNARITRGGERAPEPGRELAAAFASNALVHREGAHPTAERHLRRHGEGHVRSTPERRAPTRTGRARRTNRRRFGSARHRPRLRVRVPVSPARFRASGATVHPSERPRVVRVGGARRGRGRGVSAGGRRRR